MATKNKTDGYSFQTDTIHYQVIETKGKGKQYYVSGYISTPDIDLYNDVVTPNAMKSMLEQINERIIKIDYDHWTESVYDENNHRKDYVKDAYGNIVTIREHNGWEFYTTTYEYDVLNDLLTITDDQDNQIEYTYDSFKKEVEAAGLSIYSYYVRFGELYAILVRRTQ